MWTAIEWDDMPEHRRGLGAPGYHNIPPANAIGHGEAGGLGRAGGTGASEASEASEAPSGRYRHEMLYDGKLKRIMLLGGGWPVRTPYSRTTLADRGCPS